MISLAGSKLGGITETVNERVQKEYVLHSKKIVGLSVYTTCNLLLIGPLLNQIKFQSE